MLLPILLTGLLGVLWDGVTAFGGVRLVDGENKCSGRVEVLRHEQWGTVCDHGWDRREAHVVCLELGCGLAESALHEAHFGAGSGEIWLRHVQCSGHEASLTRCAVVLHSDAYCTHENDAGVICSGKTLLC
ncbi:putative DMBT1-like protein [Notothenia coriiceps]|uniref:DMBT1-like protein n=1 Tax=Notothenia coriiceps TaxID=8208 RepID=A0A6I9MSK3_9TELE|nr:PREDICTED: putative DMBT1-like protein [Notothenia coriiceps]